MYDNAAVQTAVVVLVILKNNAIFARWKRNNLRINFI